MGVLDSCDADLSRVLGLNAEDAVGMFGFVTAFDFENSVGNPVSLTGRKSSLDTSDGGE